MTQWLLPALSGLLYVFSFAPFDQSYLQWIAFIPLFYAASVSTDTPHGAPFKTQFKLGLITAFMVCLGGFYWLIHATGEYGELPLPASLLIMFLFCLTGQLQIPLYLCLRKALRFKRPLLNA